MSGTRCQEDNGWPKSEFRTGAPSGPAHLHSLPSALRQELRLNSSGRPGDCRLECHASQSRCMTVDGDSARGALTKALGVNAKSTVEPGAIILPGDG